jgi:hypothetical protein
VGTGQDDKVKAGCSGGFGASQRCGRGRHLEDGILDQALAAAKINQRNVTSPQRGGRGQGNGSVDGRGTSECAALIGSTGDDLGFAQPWSTGKSRTSNQQQLDTHDHQNGNCPPNSKRRDSCRRRASMHLRQPALGDLRYFPSNRLPWARTKTPPLWPMASPIL